MCVCLVHMGQSEHSALSFYHVGSGASNLGHQTLQQAALSTEPFSGSILPPPITHIVHVQISVELTELREKCRDWRLYIKLWNCCKLSR